MVDVEMYARNHALGDIVWLLKKGALAGQSPENIDNIVELDEEDRQALRFEASHRWNHPPLLYLTIALNSIGGAIQGWDQTGAILCIQLSMNV
jgi:hypothetical protein